MKLLFDQNLSRKLVTPLAEIFPDSSHVQFHGLTEADDREIWEFAKAQEICIVTQDADFAERSRLYGSPKFSYAETNRFAVLAISAVLRFLCKGK